MQAELQQLWAQQKSLLAEREAERAERESERQRVQALEAQQDGLLKFVQQLGQQHGWEIPTELLAPPPPYRRESTPVSMSTDVLLSLLMLSVKPSDGLRAGFVDVSAFVPDLLMCWPSCRKCGCRPSCRRFSCRFWKPPRAGEVLPKFSTFLYTPSIFILSLTCNLLSFLQHQSGGASNHVEGSPASHVGPSPPGSSPGSHAGASHPSQSP